MNGLSPVLTMEAICYGNLSTRSLNFSDSRVGEGDFAFINPPSSRVRGVESGYDLLK